MALPAFTDANMIFSVAASRDSHSSSSRLPLRSREVKVKLNPSIVSFWFQFTSPLLVLFLHLPANSSPPAALEQKNRKRPYPGKSNSGEHNDMSIVIRTSSQLGRTVSMRYVCSIGHFCSARWPSVYFDGVCVYPSVHRCTSSTASNSSSHRYLSCTTTCKRLPRTKVSMNQTDKAFWTSTRCPVAWIPKMLSSTTTVCSPPHSASSSSTANKKRLVLDESDIREKFVKGSGPGGQSVNKSSNNVQLTHIPTGVSVHCHESRDLTTNRSIARRLLRDKVELAVLGKDSKLARKHDKQRNRKLKAAR